MKQQNPVDRDPSLLTYGRLLREARLKCKEKGLAWRQMDIAPLVEISERTLQMYEEGKRLPKFSVRERLANVLQCEMLRQIPPA